MIPVEGNRPQPKRYSRRGALHLGAGIAGGLLLVDCQPPPPLPKPPVRPSPREGELREIRAQEEQTERIITNYDGAMDNLHGVMAQYTDDSPFRDQLLAPFTVQERNKQNPYRNVYTMRRTILESTDTERTRHELSELMRTNPFFFIIPARQINLGTQQIAAGYSNEFQAMALRPEFSSANLLDAVLGFHETVHAKQDLEQRASFQSPAEVGQYESFFYHRPGDRIKAVAGFEQEAYLMEVHALEALTGGRFKEDVLNGVVDSSAYGEELRAYPYQYPHIRLLADIANVIYGTNSTPGNLDPAYKNLY